MAYSMSERRTSRALDSRSVVVALVVLLLGVAIGFAGGYQYEHHQASTKSQKSAIAAPSSKSPTTTGKSAPHAGRQQLINCLASKGVHYPNAAQANFNTPPPGVDAPTLSRALGACYGELARAHS